MGTWIKRVRSEKFKEHQFREAYAMSLGGKRVEWYGENVEQMWEQVKCREVCGSVQVGGGNPKCVVERSGKSCGWEPEMKMQGKGVKVFGRLEKGKEKD